MSDLAASLDAGLTGADSIGDVEAQLVSTLGPAGGLNGGAGLISDLVGGNFNPGDLVEIKNPANGNVSRVQFDLHLIQQNVATGISLPFDSGLPALGLKLNGAVGVAIGYSLNLDFGFDSNIGFYISTAPGTGLSLSASLNLAGGSFTGSLGDMSLTATDHVSTGTGDAYGPTSFQANFAVSFLNLLPSAGGQLLCSPANIGVGVSLTGQADINLDASLGSSGSIFPSLSTMIHEEWDFDATPVGASDSIAGFGSEPEMGFENVTLDASGFFNRFVSPIVTDLKAVLEPLQPLVTLLNSRLPIFSDLPWLRKRFDSNHDGVVSLLEIANVLQPGNGAVQYLDDVDRLATFSDDIQPGAIDGSYGINLGSFELGGADNANGADLRILTSLSGINLIQTSASTTATIEDQLQDIGNLIGGSSGERVAGFLSNIAGSFGATGAQPGTGMDFPILDDPATAFGLLLGKDVDLFTFKLPTTLLKIPFEEDVPIFWPLGAELRGNLDNQNDWIDITTNLTFGYDTYGLNEYSADPNAQPADLQDGFYIETSADPHDLNSPSEPQVQARFGLEANGVASAILAATGAGGGITGTLDFNLNDPVVPPQNSPGQGRIHLDQIDQDLQSQTLFNLSGKVAAYLDVFALIGLQTPLGFVGYDYEYRVANVTLADFDTRANTSEAAAKSAGHDGSNTAVSPAEVAHTSSQPQDGTPSTDQSGLFPATVGSDIAGVVAIHPVAGDNPVGSQAGLHLNRRRSLPTGSVSPRSFSISELSIGLDGEFDAVHPLRVLQLDSGPSAANWNFANQKIENAARRNDVYRDDRILSPVGRPESRQGDDTIINRASNEVITSPANTQEVPDIPQGFSDLITTPMNNGGAMLADGNFSAVFRAPRQILQPKIRFVIRSTITD